MSVLGPRWRVVEKLGEGTFSEVFKVRALDSGEYCAVKRLKRRYKTIEEVHRLPEVIALLALQGHPNVVRLLDLIYDQLTGHVAFAFELCDCNLYELQSERGQAFDERTALILVYQLLNAIAFMHSKSLFHRDVKPENCMIIRDSYELKLCDFGSTRGLTSTAHYTEYTATRWYRAPECILTSGSYGAEVDEWAAGCVLVELLTGQPMFPGKHEVDQIHLINSMLGTPALELLERFSRNPNQQINLSFKPRPPRDLHDLLPGVSEATVSLITELLRYNPADRMVASVAVRHEAFAEIRSLESTWFGGDQVTPFPRYFLLGGREAPRRVRPALVRRSALVPETQIMRPQLPLGVPLPHLAPDRAMVQEKVRAYRELHMQAQRRPALHVGPAFKIQQVLGHPERTRAEIVLPRVVNVGFP